MWGLKNNSKQALASLYIADDVLNCLSADPWVHFQPQEELEFIDNGSRLAIEQWDVKIYKSDVLRLIEKIAEKNDFVAVKSKKEAERLKIGREIILDNGMSISFEEGQTIWEMAIKELIKRQKYYLKFLAEYSEALKIYKLSLEGDNANYQSELPNIQKDQLSLFKDKIEKIKSRSFTRRTGIIASEMINNAKSLETILKLNTKG